MSGAPHRNRNRRCRKGRFGKRKRRGRRGLAAATLLCHWRLASRGCLCGELLGGTGAPRFLFGARELPPIASRFPHQGDSSITIQIAHCFEPLLQEQSEGIPRLGYTTLRPGTRRRRPRITRRLRTGTRRRGKLPVRGTAHTSPTWFGPYGFAVALAPLRVGRATSHAILRGRRSGGRPWRRHVARNPVGALRLAAREWKLATTSVGKNHETWSTFCDQKHNATKVQDKTMIQSNRVTLLEINQSVAAVTHANTYKHMRTPRNKRECVREQRGHVCTFDEYSHRTHTHGTQCPTSFAKSATAPENVNWRHVEQ